MSSAPIPFEQVLGLWEDGQRRLGQTRGSDRVILERVIDEVVGELRRRLGSAFTADELARFYVEQGTDWCLDVAMRVAPQEPAAWDLTTVAGASFARYLRAARDYGGGRRYGDA